MKNIFYTILFSIITLPSFAQTAAELEEKLTRLKLENQSLTLQNKNYDSKIKDKENKLTATEKNIQQLQQKRLRSQNACKDISDDDINIIQGLSGGTIALSATSTTTGAINNITTVATTATTNKNKPTDKDETDKKEKITSGVNKGLNIASTATSAGATITSSIALSKVNGLKDDIKNCIDSFN